MDNKHEIERDGPLMSVAGRRQLEAWYSKRQTRSGRFKYNTCDDENDKKLWEYVTKHSFMFRNVR